MKHDLAVAAAGAAAGGVLVYFRDRLLGAARVLLGKAEAVAASDATKLESMVKSAALAEAAKLKSEAEAMTGKAPSTTAGTP